MGKVRSDSLLKNLPEERQEQIMEWCNTPSRRDEDGNVLAGTGGLAFARAQLAADGVKVSLKVLSEFFSWRQLKENLEISFDREEQVLEQTGDPKKAREACEHLLYRLSLATQDPALILAAAKVSDARRNLDLQEESGKTKARQKDAQIAQKDRDLALAERRVKLLEAREKTATDTLQDGTLSDAEKAAKMKQLFGIA
jgi:hypothetical protein